MDLVREIKKTDLRFRIVMELSVIFLIFVFVGPLVYFSRLKKINYFPIVSVSVTIPEGYNNREIADKFKRFKNFNRDSFLKIALDKEGYLFPDTYFFTGSENEKEIIKKMEQVFQAKAVPELAKVGPSRSKKDIIIMASILEKEARTFEDKKIVAGILWKRLEIGMPLQVDATLAYVNGKTSAEMTVGDLQSDSPYNTYTRKGLPIGPIANPGLESIKAASESQESIYLYYLSDKNGVIRYAKDFEGHQVNRVKYLK